MSQAMSLLANLVADTQPIEFTPEIPFELGGDLPLDNIKAYKMAEPSAHWLLVTEGFKEFDFELTFRVANDSEEAPKWAIELVKWLAKVAFQRNKGFEVGQLIDLGRPVINASDCFLTTLFFVEDAMLPVDAEGEPKFLQVSLITADEAMAVRGWQADKMAQLIGLQVKHHIVELGRFSLLMNENIRNAITRGRAKDGSNTEAVPSGSITFQIYDQQRAYVEIDALAGEYLEAVMPGRLPLGNPVTVVSEEQQVTFIPSEEARIRGVGDTWIEFYMTPNMYNTMMENIQKRVKRFFFEEFDDIAISINDHRIKDENGCTVGVKPWR